MVFTKLASKFVSKQVGGADTTVGLFSLLLVGLIILLINSFLVYYTYNYVMPKLLIDRFVPITFVEALYLVILGHALFC